MEEEYYYRIESKSKLSPVYDDYVLIKRREEFLDLCTNTDMFDYYLYDLEDGELIGYDDGLESYVTARMTSKEFERIVRGL